MKQKLTSRKFWVAVAAFLLSLSNSIAGLHANNQALVVVGTICGTLSAAIYAFSEAYVDGSRLSNQQSENDDILGSAIGFDLPDEEQKEVDE